MIALTFIYFLISLFLRIFDSLFLACVIQDGQTFAFSFYELLL